MKARKNVAFHEEEEHTIGLEKRRSRYIYDGK